MPANNPFMEQILSNTADANMYTEAEVIEAVNRYAVSELEKVAEAEDTDLSEFSDQDVEDIIGGYIDQNGGYEKLASHLGLVVAEEDDLFTAEEQEKIASSADIWGQIAGQSAARSFQQQLATQASNSVWREELAVEEADLEKLAALEPTDFDEEFEKLAMDRASTILIMAHDAVQQQAEALEALDEEQEEKLAQLNDLEDHLHARALDILEENGFDVDLLLDAAN